MAFQDKTLKCKDCEKDFVFTAGEQEFYAEKVLKMNLLVVVNVGVTEDAAVMAVKDRQLPGKCMKRYVPNAV